MSSTGSHVEGRMVVSGREKWVGLSLRWIVIIVAVSFALFPVLWIFSAAFNPTGNLANQTLIPQNVESLDELLTNFRGLLVEDVDIHPFYDQVTVAVS